MSKVIKKEKQPAKPSLPPCLASLGPQAAAMRIRRQIEKLSATAEGGKEANTWLNDYYKNKISSMKSSKNADKQKNLHELMNATDLASSEFFQRIRRDVVTESDRTTGTWMSWKQVLDLEHESVAKLSLAQGRLQSRPSSQLDHSKPETKELPEELQLEYRYVVQQDIMDVSKSSEIQKSDSSKPVDSVAVGKDEAAKKRADIVERAQKTSRMWGAQSKDIETRLGQYADNEYLGIFILI